MGRDVGRDDALEHDDGSVSVVLSPYDPAWPARFAGLAAALRAGLGGLPAEVHHIGSTAVPGLLAKPRIDVQVGVGDVDEAARRLAGVPGLVPVPGNDDRRKRFLRGDDVNVHVRRAGEFSGQAALLLRDFLRSDDAARDRYAAVKERLAARAWVSVDAYADAKGGVVWSLLRSADAWAMAVGWRPPPSDG